MGKAKKSGDAEAEQPVVQVKASAKTKPSVQAKPSTKIKAKNDEQIVLSEEEDIPSNKSGKKKKNVNEDKKPSELSKNVKKVDNSKKKNVKNKVVSSDDDSNSESDSDSDDDRRVKGKSKPQPKKGGFALLQLEDSDECRSSSDDDDETSSEEEAPKKVVPKKQTQKDVPKEQAGKKGKNLKKKKDDSDDDIDKVLAQLNLEQSKATTRSEKGSKKTEASEVKDETSVEDDGKSKDPEAEETSAKTAAQKKKEKKLKQQAAKKLEAVVGKEVPTERKDSEKAETPVEDIAKVPDTASTETQDTPVVETQDAANVDASEADKKKKKKKGEKIPVVEEKPVKKGPAKKAIAAMQEALKKIKEDEERHQREEEERIRLAEEQEDQRLEQLRLEKEKKDRKKKKEKERKDRLKAEGKFMTPKQKADKARALAMIESLREQTGEGNAEEVQRKPRLGTRIRPNKLKKQTSEEQQNAAQEGENKKTDSESNNATAETKEAAEAKAESIKESWDAESDHEGQEQHEEKKQTQTKIQTKVQTKVQAEKISNPSDDDDSDSDEDSDSSEEEKEEKPVEVAVREKAIIRMKKREEDNEANRSVSLMRAAVVCVLGHVDTGKTKILDKLRRTNVQDGEAGGITQQIGATNVPIENIKDQTRHVKGVSLIEFKIPGLLIIDTPGHESFSNLRSRGSSLCDIAILVVDIMHGLEPQTIESLNLLKARKTPFIVALNKIDRLYDWQSAQRKDVKDIIKSQHVNTQNEFETRTKEVILQFAEQGLNAALFYENPDVRTYVSLVPTSAVTGEGMGNLLAIIIQSCEGLLHKRLLYSKQLQATVLEVKAIPGLGMTIDTILINGSLKEGDTVVLAGTDGPIVTQIRSLLMPQPMKELRVKNAYIEHKEVIAAQGVKITAKDLEKAVAGLNLLVAHKTDEIEILKDEVTKELKKALSGIKLSDRGVYVQASTLGSLEALLEFLKASKIPYSAIRIGPVVKRDVMKASAMLEHESQYACILAFDVKIERDAQEMADSVGVTIFQADIIYHLFDKFMAHRDALKARKREEFKHIAVFPCKLKILPQYVFNSRDPIVIGVIVEAGIVKEGTPICVPNKEFVDIGIVTSIEASHKNVETARKGMEVCIKIDPIPGESPKMFGRHFDETDFLVSKISRPSIDACKDYFRDDLLKTDWQLMVELKNLFQIL